MGRIGLPPSTSSPPPSVSLLIQQTGAHYNALCLGVADRSTFSSFIPHLMLQLSYRASTLCEPRDRSRIRGRLSQSEPPKIPCKSVSTEEIVRITATSHSMERKRKTHSSCSLCLQRFDQAIMSFRRADSAEERKRTHRVAERQTREEEK